MQSGFSAALHLARILEREQNGQCFLPSADADGRPSPYSPGLAHDGCEYGWLQPRKPNAPWRGVPFRNNSDFWLKLWGLEADPTLRHEKNMHLADRLLRAYPGRLLSETKHAMAVYRRLQPHELVLANWDDVDDELGLGLR